MTAGALLCRVAQSTTGDTDLALIAHAGTNIRHVVSYNMNGGCYKDGFPPRIAIGSLVLQFGHITSLAVVTSLTRVPGRGGLCTESVCGRWREPLRRQMRPVSWAHMATSTRFRAPSFRMRLARWALTVLGVMYSSLAISSLVRPWATGTRTSSSRAVSGSIGCLGGEVCAWANAASSRTVTLGAISASPSAAAWMAWVSRAGPASLSRNPRAPALSAP